MALYLLITVHIINFDLFFINFYYIFVYELEFWYELVFSETCGFEKIFVY